MNKNREAVRAFESAARLSPAWALPHLHLGLQYQARGENTAEKEFKMAVNLDPRQPFLRESLAVYYQRRGQYMDAERELDTLVGATPGYANAYRQLGALYEATRQYSKAADAFETYLRLAPNAADRAAVRGLIAKERAAGVTKAPTLVK